MKIPELISKNKHVFGTYATMALNNIQIVLDHIQKIANLGDYKPDRGVEDYWDHPVMQCLSSKHEAASVTPEKVALVIEKLQLSFPFLKSMADSQREHWNKNIRQATEPVRKSINRNDITYVLGKMFSVLKTYRDYSVHYIFIDDRLDNNDSKFWKRDEHLLSYVIHNHYTAALREVKERYGYDIEDLAFIQNHRVKKIQGKKQTDFNFFLSMQSLNDDPNKKAHLSGPGIVQLICLFLEKKYINLFLAKLPAIYGPYTEASENCRIIRRSLSIKSIVLPKERIQSEKSALSLTLDMLNELKRCPMELFNTLSQEDQDRFRVPSVDHNEALLARSSDRFARHALQYIDLNRLFDSTRFQINMGKLRYLFAAEKKCIDGGVRVRVLEHPLNGFGRIDEMENWRKSDNGTFGDSGIRIRDFENMQRDDNCPANYPYVVDTYTQYLLDNNKFGLFFCDDKCTPEIVCENGKWYVDKAVPHCQMSTLELPAMMFHIHLMGAKNTEKRIRSVYNNYIRLFNAMENGTLTADNIDSFGISRQDMPQKVLDSISGENKTKNLRAHACKVVAELIDESQRLIKRFRETKNAVDSKTNKAGSRRFKSISTGKLADYLAADIVRFQPSFDEEGHDKLTGLNYRIMQASIAVYDSMGNPSAIEDFKEMFKAAKLTWRGNASHPFLDAALSRNPKNTVEFYEQYLIARKFYLEKINRELPSYTRDSICKLPFIKGHRVKWAKRDADFYKIAGEQYTYYEGKHKPIDLPRQMFDEEIKSALQKLPQMKGVDFDNSNVTYLIGEYLKRVLNDDFQGFYNWKRNYRYLDMLQCIVSSKESLVKQYLTTAEREELWRKREERIAVYKDWAEQKKKNDRNLIKIPDSDYKDIVTKRLTNERNDFQKSEKHIRRYKVQDALMFLMAKNSLTQHLQFRAQNFKLKDIMPDSDKGILSEIMPIDFSYQQNGRTYTIKSEGIKLKNYGDFFTLANDKRMTSLMKILETNIVYKDELECELNTYDDNRPEIVKLILDFEKDVYARYPDIALKAKTEPKFAFRRLLEELCLKKDVESVKERLNSIRNAFDHNQYPRKEIVTDKTLPNIAKELIAAFDYAARFAGG